MDNKFCVYFLRCSDTGNVVYIGSGTVSRAMLRKARSEALQEYCKSHDVKTEIIKSGLSKEQSLKLEQEYLNKYYDKDTVGFDLFNSTGIVAITKEYEYGTFSEMFYYDPSSPTFLRWKVDRYGTGRAKIMKVGDVAGYVNAKGATVSLNYSAYLVHRVIYCLKTGKDVPVNLVVDHIDRNPMNNAFENLRLVTQSENMKNRDFNYLQSNNKTGVVGVYFHQTEWNKYWAARYKRKVKYFNIDKYGEEVAYQMAVKAREDLVRDNKE